MLKKPSRRNYKYEFKRPNLIPVLDAVFIFIFFLLLSADFINVFEINSNAPIISNSPPPKNKKIPLNLTLSITNNRLILKKGNPLRVVKVINKDGPEFNLYGLHQELIKIKKRNPEERTIIFEPRSNVAYDIIVKVMDEVRLLRNTDESIYIKDKKTRQDKKINYLFDDIIFGNIRS